MEINISRRDASAGRRQTTSPCSVCATSRGDGGALVCGHAFCVNCFSRFTYGSVQELHLYARCCVCGESSILIQEQKGEPILRQFGRETNTKLLHVTAFAKTHSSAYVVVDKKFHRVHFLATNGSSIRSFQVVYKYDILPGVAVDKLNRVVLPVLTKDCVNAFNTTRHVALAYYSAEGNYLNSAYLPENTDVKGIAVNSRNEVVCTDYENSLLLIVHEKQRLLKSIELNATSGDDYAPKPWGIAISDSNDNIYVTDVANHAVRVYTRDGQLVTKFGCFGERPGQFKAPRGVGVDTANRVIVADSGNNRVQLFNSDHVFERFIVRYNKGDDVYMEVSDTVFHNEAEVAVLLTSPRDWLPVAEIRIYNADGHPDMLSC